MINESPFHASMLIEKSESLKVSDGTIHLLLCSMALEAFIQDLRSFYTLVNSSRITISSSGGIFQEKATTTSKRGGLSIDGESPVKWICDEELRLMNLLDGIEKESPSRKYEIVLNYLKVSDWNKGQDEVFKDIVRMNKLRNLIVHLKSDAHSLNDSGHIEEFPKVIKELKSKGVNFCDNSVRGSWIHCLDDDSFITWCRSVIIKAIESVLDALPDSDINKLFKDNYLSNIDTFQHLKN